MAKYLLKRVGQMLVVIVIVSLVTFFLMDLVPQDVVYTVAGSTEIDDEVYDRIYHELNLDKSTIERYFLWVSNAIKGDFGTSYKYNEPVWDLIKDRIPTTLFLAIASMLISVPIGIFFGIISAVYRKKWPDTVITLLANISHCLPQFWVAILLLYFFCMKSHVFISMGFGFPSEVGWVKFFRTATLPVFCTALNSIAGFTRQTRSSMLEVIRQDYVRTARSKGLSEKKVYFKHMMKNGLIPIVTILGSRLAHILGGSMIVENVFAIPGMGLLARTAVQAKDMPTIQAIVLLTTLVSCAAYILTDVIYVVIDPRISLSESGD